MYNNNLFEDFKNQINIPENEKKSFKITLSNLLPNAIQIDIDEKENTNLFNLYLIIKSYLNNLKFIPDRFLIVISDVNHSFFIADNLDFYFFKSVSLNNFIIWMQKKFLNDSKYLTEKNIYSFVFTYKKNYDENLLEKIKPIYPWKENILNNLIKNIEKEQNFISIIDMQKKKIEELQKEIEKLKK